MRVKKFYANSKDYTQEAFQWDKSHEDIEIEDIEDLQEEEVEEETESEEEKED